MLMINVVDGEEEVKDTNFSEQMTTLNLKLPAVPNSEVTVDVKLWQSRAIEWGINLM